LAGGKPAGWPIARAECTATNDPPGSAIVIVESSKLLTTFFRSLAVFLSSFAFPLRPLRVGRQVVHGFWKMVYQIMHDSVDCQDTRWFVIVVDNRQVPKTALSHHANRISHGRAARDRRGRTRHYFANGSRQIGPAHHLLQRVAFRENADQLRTVAYHDCTRALRTQKLQHIANGVVGSRSKRLIGVGRTYSLML